MELREGYRRVFWPSVTLFALVSVAAGTGWLHGPDTVVLHAAQIPASPALDVLASIISLAGSLFLTAGLTLALAVGIYIRGRRSLAVRLILGLLAITVVEVALKLYLPVPSLPLERLRAVGDEFIFTFPNPYPSGHMMRTAFLAGAVALLDLGKAVFVGAGVMLVAMAATRVYLGVHWASDVAGGALLAVATLAWAFGTERRAHRAAVKKRAR